MNPHSVRTPIARLLRALVEGRIVVGAAAAAITAWTARVLDAPVEFPLLLAVAGATIVIYDLDRIFDRRGESAPVPRVVRWTLAGGLATLAVILPALEGATAVTILLGLPLCALYCVPIPWLAGARPKDHPVGKALFVALSVTLATILLPILEAGRTTHALKNSGHILLAGAWVFSAILGNALACDLRDHAHDLAARLRTIPTTLGVRRTRAMLIALQVTIFVGTAIAVRAGALPGASLLPIAALAIALLSLQEAQPRWIWGCALDGAFLPLFLLGV